MFDTLSNTVTLSLGLIDTSSNMYCYFVSRAVRHLFEGIAVRQEEAREKNLTPPEFKVMYVHSYSLYQK